MLKQVQHDAVQVAAVQHDGVIDPAKTRDVLGLALAACGEKDGEAPGFGVFRM